MDFKLGKLPARHDPRTLRVANYLRPEALPPVPTTIHLEHAVPSWPMYANDRYGCCVWADTGHEIELWTALAGHEISVTDANILKGYSDVTGFNPNDPSTDQGTVWLDALKYWRSTGVGGHRITGFASVDHTNHTLMRQALWLFEGVQLGIALPLSAQDQVGKVWKCTTGGGSAAGSWGGHAVPVVAVDRYHLWVVTWGALQQMTWGFANRYIDEAYCALSPESIVSATQKTPEGFDLKALNADLAQFPVAA